MTVTERATEIARKFFSWVTPQFERAFEQRLRVEIVKTELLRINILIRILFAAFIAAFLNFFFLGEEKIYNFLYANLDVLILSVSILVIYELFSRQHVKRMILKRKTLSRRYQIINLAVEMSFPTAVMLFFLLKDESEFILYSPFMLIYFVFIVLSTLHLDFWISAFSGLIAAIEYFMVSVFTIYELPQIAIEPFYVASYTIIIARSVVILLSGVAAGFVALEIKRRVINTSNAVNERNKIRQVFGQHVSYSLVDQLINDKTAVSNRKQFVCVMFLDIRNFTPFAEQKTPEEVMDYQNKVFGNSIEVVNKHNGIINQFLGDGFMATFGAPISAGNDCQNAVNAALEILEFIRKSGENEYIPVTKLGIGIHYGEAITGSIGTELRKQYSIVGNVVILASRIEQLNKEFNSQLLISKDVYEKLHEVSGESLGLKLLKGESKMTEVIRIK